jgi:hypothetical protein
MTINPENISFLASIRLSEEEILEDVGEHYEMMMTWSWP